MSGKNFCNKVSVYTQLLSALFLTLLFLSNCSAPLSSIYDSNFSLTSEVAKSKMTNLSVKIPSGWFSAEDNECKCTDLWLVKDDYSATLNFVNLNLDSLTVKEIRNNDLQKIIEFSKTFVRVKLGKDFKEFTNEENFEINGQKFRAYQYSDNKNRNIRVVVFKSRDRYYELSAIPVKMNNPDELFKVQNSVLASISK